MERWIGRDLHKKKIRVKQNAFVTREETKKLLDLLDLGSTESVVDGPCVSEHHGADARKHSKPRASLYRLHVKAYRYTSVAGCRCQDQTVEVTEIPVGKLVGGFKSNWKRVMKLVLDGSETELSDNGMRQSMGIREVAR
ncbi:hypothetical protein GUITHDRAFT_111409 [Guillardia theta CCMP2712]|uniref:Uncharacterized protein n=1 Tax=Guillardia theta (strain CCMP2712) TaxID=905079 RepID=L1J1N1_GUITC|nr:hypothetical protein GUITHDRAFT_111409 [Guillardia theta CCMP2712]EKX42433.1 hypothetical protein GUITHDRAFT_111409 [Guillardia theta CCMP2712]|eukprot:XP_005829413.1 hypothetical protein GUITHDRAFT_111409 [Guillardia theta CCMP2712]